MAATAVLLLTRFAAAADPALSADFDGDGRRDRVTLDRAQPSVLHVWLSSTNAVADIHSHSSIVRVVARDLDGDRRPELIAGVDGGLQVWTRNHHGFRTFTPRRVVDADLRRPGRRAIDDGPSGSRSAIQWTGGSIVARILTVEVRGPDSDQRRAFSSLNAPFHSAPALPRFAPRPPPSLL